MKTQIFTLLALASSAQVATATFQWLDAKSFACPANTDNKCIEPQKNGFSWEGLNLGSFKNFGDFDFDGFECADSFDGKQKRDEITGRTFQNKCIKAKVTENKSPSFGCKSSKSVEKFSVKTFQVSVEFDVELEFHYEMPNGSTCKQKQSCKKSGTTVKNTQCGGATKVKVTIPKGSSKGKSCNVGFHHIDFDCEKPQATSTPAVPSSTSTSTRPSTTPASSTAAIPTPTPETSTSSTSTASPVESSATPTPTPETSESASATASESTSAPASETADIPTPTPESTTSTASPVDSTTAPPFPANSTTAPPAGETSPPTAVVPTTLEPTTIFSTSVFTETHVSTITSCGAAVKDCPAGSSTVITETSVTSTIVAVTTAVPQQSTVVVVDHTTLIVETSTTLCPVTLTHITAGSTTIETGISTSTIFLTSTSTICTKCTVVPTTTPAQTPAESSAVPTSPVVTSSVGPITTKTTPSIPVPTSDCPAVLPQCLNTWLFSSGCKSNTDVNCFCSSNNFVDNVYKCLSAHGASDNEVDAAEKYFQGICAAHVPENPAIVTGVNTLTLTVTATPSVHTAPVTTIVLQTTIISPCTQTAGPSEGSIIPGSSTTKVISTAITVPQVVFETITGTATNVVSLVQGTPTAPATITGVFTTPLVVAPVTPTTFASVSFISNSTTTAKLPAFTGAASRSGMTAGSFFAAGLVALMAL